MIIIILALLKLLAKLVKIKDSEKEIHSNAATNADLVLQFVHHPLEFMLCVRLSLGVAQLHSIEHVPKFLHVCIVLGDRL